MTIQGSVQELLKTLDKDGKQAVRDFMEKIEKDESFLQSSCLYLVDKIGDPELMNEFEKMSDSVKRTACIEYLIIALNSGGAKMKEIVDMIK